MLAYDAIYDKSAVGAVEIKKLPRSLVIQSACDSDYFERDSDLFMRLFRYIDDHGVAMTVPVEGEIEPGRMRFYIGSGEDADRLPNREGVDVITVPERTVASLGIRGGYTEEVFSKAKVELERWLSKQADWQAIGEAYAVYWHGPFVPGFIRRSEVHIQVGPVEVESVSR